MKITVFMSAEMRKWTLPLGLRSVSLPGLPLMRTRAVLATRYVLSCLGSSALSVMVLFSASTFRSPRPQRPPIHGPSASSALTRVLLSFANHTFTEDPAAMSLSLPFLPSMMISASRSMSHVTSDLPVPSLSWDAKTVCWEASAPLNLA